MTLPVSSAIDSLDAAVKVNLIQNHEYYLQGSIHDDQVETLLQKLRGLCDNAHVDPETFRNHEISFTIKKSPLPEPSLALRIRRAMDHPEMPCQLRFIGLPEINDKNQPTAIRSSIDVVTKKDILDFIIEMGCKLDFEYVSRGYMFRKGRMKITVSKIFRVKDMNLNENGVEPLNSSHLVEMSVLAPSKQKAIGDEMKVFSEQLKPLVHMEARVHEEKDKLK